MQASSMRKEVEKPQLGKIIVGAVAARFLCILFRLTRDAEYNIRLSAQGPRSTREYTPDKQYMSNMMSASVCVHEDGLVMSRSAPYQTFTGDYPGCYG